MNRPLLFLATRADVACSDPIRVLAELEPRANRLADARQLSGPIDGGQELRDIVQTHLTPSAVIGRSPT